MEREEYDKSRARDKEEENRCLAGLNEKDKITALFVVIIVQASELGGSKLTVEEAINNYYCDNCKHNNNAGIIGAVKKLLKAYENRS